MIRKRTSLVLFILALVIAAPLAVMRAQSGAQTDEAESLAGQLEAKFSGGWLERLRELRAQQIEGSWALVINPVVPPGVPAPPPLTAYASFARGGVFLGAGPSRPYGKQFGAWVHVSGNEFATTVFEDVFNQSGTFTGRLKLRMRIILTSRDEFVGVATAEDFDPGGNVTALRCARFKGERIKVEPLAPQCQSINPVQ
jgi:hypothetical protein